MRIVDQSQTEDGGFYIHWLAREGGGAMVFRGVSDEAECYRIHSFVMQQPPDLAAAASIADVPAQGASFTLNQRG